MAFLAKSTHSEAVPVIWEGFAAGGKWGGWDFEDEGVRGGEGGAGFRFC
jgi:hypothetical protein